MVVAAGIFGPKWNGRLLQFSVDNMAVVHILNSTYSKDAHLMHLIRILVFLAAHFDFWFVAKHVEGRANSLADNLSRNHLHNFFSQVPQAERHPPPHIPAQLPDLLGEQSPCMDIHRLDQAVQQFYQAALTQSTHKTYEAAEQKYLSFCTNFSLSPLPTTENILCYFAACLGQEGLAVKNGRSPHPRLPITPSILYKLCKVWLEDNSSFNHIMLWVAATTTFFGFCRSGEITVECESKFDPKIHLSLADLAVDKTLAPSVISIQLKRSKTDQVMKGVKLVIGKTNNDLYPVTALLSYLARRGNTPGQLFQWDNHTHLSKSKFVEHVRQALLRANIPAHLYTGHSFRIGAATTAKLAGIQDSTIQTLGRWKSSAYLLYIQLNPSHLADLSSTMAHSSI